LVGLGVKILTDGQTFKLRNKVYIFTKTLRGYDDYFVRHELNRLLSFGLVKRLKGGDNYLECHYELPEYPRDGY
jgi:hypothetical protein